MQWNAARCRAVLYLSILLVLLPSVRGRAWDESEPVAVRRAILWTQTSDDGWVTGVRTRVFSWLEAGFTLSAEDLFEPRIRVHLVENLPPVRTSLVASPDRIGFFTQVLLGPVHAAMGRAWGASPLRWAVVTVAGSRTIALSAGWRMPGGLTAEIRVRLASSILWELSLFFRDGSVGLGGAVWR